MLYDAKELDSEAVIQHRASLVTGVGKGRGKDSQAMFGFWRSGFVFGFMTRNS